MAISPKDQVKLNQSIDIAIEKIFQDAKVDINSEIK